MEVSNDCGGRPKTPKNVTSTFFNSVHLLPKYLRFEHGSAKFASCPRPHLTSLRSCPLHCCSDLWLWVFWLLLAYSRYQSCQCDLLENLMQAMESLRCEQKTPGKKKHNQEMLLVSGHQPITKRATCYKSIQIMWEAKLSP